MIPAKEALAQAKAIAGMARFGKLTYEDAKERTQPLLAIVNQKGKEIAKKYNVTYKPVNFTTLAR